MHRLGMLGYCNFINLGLIDNFVSGIWVDDLSWKLNDIIGNQLYEILNKTNGLMKRTNKMKDKENSKKNKTFTLDFFVYLLIFIAIIGIICYFPVWFTEPGKLDFRNTGQIGDTIGGIMGPFVAIAASILTFLAFWVQFKANEQQRKDIALERFESNLFELIHIQQDITNNLIFVEKKGNNNKVQAQGRDVFQYVYEDYNFSFGGLYYDNTPTIIGVKTLMQYQNVNQYTDLKKLGCLDHYFRHLYRVFKYINDSDVIDSKDKYKYACMVRASLSQYELIMLFYNCLSSNGNEKFKPLIETYAIFNNIRVELLAKQEHKNLYKEKAYQKLNDND